jgi:hypothetical protein
MLRGIFCVSSGIALSAIVTYLFSVGEQIDINVESITDEGLVRQPAKGELALVALGSFSVGTFMAAHATGVL